MKCPALRTLSVLALATSSVHGAPMQCEERIFANEPDHVVGSPCSPHTTIQQAIDAADEYLPERIEVRRGTYTEDIDLDGKPVVIYSLDGPQFTAIVGTGNGPVVTCASGEPNTSAIVGFCITGGGDSGSLGGGVHVSNGARTGIVGCEIVGNDALVGGGIYVEGSDVLIANCTIRSNTATRFGAGIYLENSDSRINHCTIVDNECDLETGGALRAFAGSDPGVANSILWNNAPDQVSSDGSSQPQLWSCDVMGGWFGPGGNNIPFPPMFVDAPNGDLRLAPGSPCIDAGDVARLPADPYDLDLDGDLAEDMPLDGEHRLRRWDMPGGLPIVQHPSDRGAHEANPHDDEDASKVKRSELGHELWPVHDQGESLFVPYTATHPLWGTHPEVRRAVFVVHSSGRGANFSLDTVEDPARDEGLEDETLIVAPQFLEDQDLALGGYGFQRTDIAYWRSGWNRAAESEPGGASAGPIGTLGAFGARPFEEASFAFLDSLIEHVVTSGKFPSLEKVVLVGHSSGGQFTNRFSLASRVEDEVVRPAGLEMRYVPTSPGAWAFVSPFRPSFAFPPADLRNAVRPGWWIPGLPGYHEWPFGLGGDFPAYFDALGDTDAEIRDAVIEQYERREVVVLIDSCDADPFDDDLPFGPEANLLGIHRYDRAQNFFANVVEHYGPHVLGWQRLAIIDAGCPVIDGVPGFRHDSRYNYDSRMGRRWILDVPAEPAGSEMHPGRRILRVDANQNGVGDGLTWNTAFADLQDACLSAASWGGDVNQIWVAEGEYRPDRGTRDRTHSFPILQGVATLGGFSGLLGAQEQRDHERDPDAFPCVLTGDIAGNTPAGFREDDSLHVVTGHRLNGVDYFPETIDLWTQEVVATDVLQLDDPPGPETPQVFEDFTGVIDGFTIRHGNASVIGPFPPTNSSIVDFVSGGGVAASAGAPLVQDCVVERCEAELGAGISALHPNGIEVRRCVLTLNQANHGGGLFLAGGTATVVRCEIVDNFGEYGGGVACTTAADLRLDSCVVRENHAGEVGAAIAFLVADGLVVNCLVDNNIAWGDRGCAIYVSQGAPAIRSSTIVRNVANGPQAAGALLNVGGTPTVGNCVMWTNLGGPMEINGGGVQVEFTRADDHYPGTFNIVEDPRFVDWVGGDFRLKHDSPCVDSGHSGIVPSDAADLDDDRDEAETLPFDLLGAPRIVDDLLKPNTGVGLPPVDRGAYETPSVRPREPVRRTPGD